MSCADACETDPRGERVKEDACRRLSREEGRDQEDDLDSGSAKAAAGIGVRDERLEPGREPDCEPRSVFARESGRDSGNGGYVSISMLGRPAGREGVVMGGGRGVLFVLLRDPPEKDERAVGRVSLLGER